MRPSGRATRREPRLLADPWSGWPRLAARDFEPHPAPCRFVVELAAILDSELLRHGDLDASHVVAIPDRFKHWIREAGVENVLYRFLSQKMIDAEDSFFGEIAVQNSVEFLRRRQVTPEGLLHHDTRILSAA